MTPAARKCLDQLRTLLRPASIATAGGFRPPSDPVTSWFCRGVGQPGENLPQWNGRPMIPILQIRIDELPYVPEQLAHLALIVVFFDMEDLPFDKPHGEGWVIREYTSTDGLVPLPEATHDFKPFPIRWTRVEDDAPYREGACALPIDMGALDDDEAAEKAFYDDFQRYDQTKVGGYPTEVQSDVGVEDFVFQIGSEEKVHLIWVDAGIAYFFRTPDGAWRWACEFY
ncbi:DUF1963 domain-containing protein [Komagataeibacter xylinus]|uniref:DUF1963 domain-containing protein n=1 Tax=Komagataeibacter xylinus TaxID=28448 RepID=UPI00102F4D71|nr:DUF1963 domain-containing protein [Komagataeibacter xylinus]